MSEIRICKFCKKNLEGWTTLGMSYHPQCFEFVLMNGLFGPMTVTFVKDYWTNYPNGWTDVKKGEP